MARNKAVFDADILINMVKTKSLDYLTVFEDSKLPRTVKDRNGNVLRFSSIMAKSYDKFNKSENLSSLLKLLMDKHK